MNQDETFFHTLADFRDVRIASNHQQSKESSLSSVNQTSQEPQLETNFNEDLLKNFKQLREKLKEANHLNQKLRGKLVEKENEVDRVKLNEKDNVSQIYQLKTQLQRLKQENQENKEKLKYLKETAKDANKSSQELEYLKISVCDLKKKIKELQEQNKKILEISVMEKVGLEEKIKKLEIKENSEVGYVQTMEIQISKLRQKCMKLQNQLKKAEIKYEEELYNKKWMNGNFQRQHLEQQIQQFQSQNEELSVKLKKEKEKRNGLEKRVLELQELSGLWTIKAETFQIQNKALNKKIKKIDKKNTQLKQNADKKIAQTLSIEEKFLKSIAIAEELIGRVKRQLIGDAVVLAKTCQYKLNKLKQEKETFCLTKQKENFSRKSPIAIRARSKSKAKPSPTRKLFIEQNEKPKFQFVRSQLTNERSKQIEIIKDEAKQRDIHFSLQTSQSSKSPLTQIDNIELKIRREREQMEKKIREKMLYRQIEVANSPQKHRLREDYFRLIEK